MPPASSQGSMSALRRLGTLAIASTVLFLLVPAAGMAIAGTGGSAGVSHAPQNLFNRPGNLLITDQFNNRVIEVNPLTNAIVWSFGTGNASLCNPGPRSIIGPNDAERLAG